jgi:hypothetical protein
LPVSGSVSNFDEVTFGVAPWGIKRDSEHRNLTIAFPRRMEDGEKEGESVPDVGWSDTPGILPRSLGIFE